MSNSTLTNNYEGGTAGASVGSSTAGGSAFTATDPAVIFTTTHVHGTLGASASNMATTGTALNRWALTTETTVKAVAYFYLTAAPVADLDIITIFTTAGAGAAYARINSVGRLRLVTSGGVNAWTDSVNFPLNTWVRIELYADIGSSTSSGTASLERFPVDSFTAGASSGALTGINTGNGSTNTYGAVRFGKTGSSAYASVGLNWDDVACYTGTNALLGTPQPSTIPSPPTITASGDQTLANPGVGVNLTSVGTPDAGASIASYQWTAIAWPASLGSAPSLSGSTSQNASFTPSARGRYVFSVTCKDNYDQVSATAFTAVNVTDTVISAIRIVANSGWTLSAIGNLADSSDTSYAESSASGVGSVLVLRLAPLIANPATFRLDLRELVTAVGGTQRVELVEGATTIGDGTVRKNWGAVSPGTTITNDSLTLTTLELSGSTGWDWNNLSVRLTEV